MHRTVIGNVLEKILQSLLRSHACSRGHMGMADTNPAVVCDYKHINMGY